MSDKPGLRDDSRREVFGHDLKGERSGMMPDLRTRIAAIIDREIDGLWEPLDVADALIRKLKLTPEWSVGDDDTGRVVWDSREEAEDGPLQIRYVTEWTADE